MLSYAAAYAEAHGLTDIYFAVNADDALRFPDCSAAFIEALNTLWQTCPNTMNLTLKAPLLESTKTQVVQQAITLGVALDQTLSCYTPVEDKECGSCLSCTVKLNALAQL
jgi:7-cyano-7-deazaguanine synthase